MGMLDRFADIIKANVNDLLDRAEDPAKMVDQYLRDLAESLAEVKEETVLPAVPSRPATRVMPVRSSLRSSSSRRRARALPLRPRLRATTPRRCVPCTTSS